ncbi:serine/threonine-protein kinase [Nonomuraea angiospora]|uniref:non-specific serine/threonine protein kinase n=1 Tax=Nonomuraea angiospora TaxID=46172 RepID=A0ABR9LY14_9ACTN|nr:serine/threonine-protein kinase [Nonomuraea angiospora]MBE1585265.1 serine/threonine protein kinase [Nonomuraea angiospora]
MTAPSQAGRYRIEQLIGVGGFASVYLAHDDELRSPVAVKILADNWARRPDVRERFLQEARLLRRADSHLLVQVFDVGELDDGRPYFVMTYADRGTLEERLSGGALAVEEALGLMRDICQGVAVLHSIRVVHRDLKPSNVLFCSRPEGGERVMVADLGIARSTDHLSGLTLPAGSPGYQAPEQLYFDGAPDARADVHGLGALTYHMLTGRVPAKPEQRVPPSALRPEVPEAVDAAVMRALDPGREARWPDAAAYAAALSSSTAVPPPGGEPQLRPSSEEAQVRVPEGGRRPGRRRAIAGGAAAVVAAAAVTAVAVNVAQSPQAPGGTHAPGGTRATASPSPAGGSTSQWLRDDSDIPGQYRDLIVRAGTYCQEPGLSPALIAAMLKAESGYDPGLSDPVKDEYGISRWTPSVLWYWQPGGLQSPKPTPPFSPELSILSMGRFLCTLGPRVADLPGDPALKLAALYRSGVDPLRRAGGIPERWRDYTEKVSRYLRDYRPV